MYSVQDYVYFVITVSVHIPLVPADARSVPKQGSAPPPPTARESPTAIEGADIKKMSASTNSLEKSGGVQSSVTKRIKGQICLTDNSLM